jgi:hypothetical protein
MSNFLDLQCPHCGSEDRIRIAGTTWLDVTSEGTCADNSDHEYEPTSAAMCCACDFYGTVSDFEDDG